MIPALTGHAVDIGTGAECVTLCSFHEDTHPSLRVNNDKQQVARVDLSGRTDNYGPRVGRVDPRAVLRMYELFQVRMPR